MRLLDPPVVAASLSGESDADWARTAAPYVGAAILGGIALDGPTRRAARAMIGRGRDEFLPPEPIAFMADQLEACEPLPLRAGWNVRAVETPPIRTAAAICADYGAILEINAHCRQDEMCAAGAGEHLLRQPERLREQVWAAAASGATVSVKVRTEVSGVDLPSVAEIAGAAGADIIHVDAMDSEAVVADVVAATDATVIANNGVRDRATVREYADYGADAVSVGRPSDDPVVLARVRRAAGAVIDSDRVPGTDVGAP
ncbi:MAG: tRNA-dihydrouridine synthase [Halanaeroarchaeum sp.]